MIQHARIRLNRRFAVRLVHHGARVTFLVEAPHAVAAVALARTRHARALGDLAFDMRTVQRVTEVTPWPLKHRS